MYESATFRKYDNWKTPIWKMDN